MGRNIKRIKRERSERTSLENIFIKILIGVSISVVSAIILYFIFGRSTTPPPPPPQAGDLIVTASVDDPNPPQYSTVHLSVNVKDESDNPVTRATITATAHYSAEDTTKYDRTDDFGNAELSFRISRAKIGYEVIIKVKAEKDESEGFAKTSFIPRTRDN